MFRLVQIATIQANESLSPDIIKIFYQDFQAIPTAIMETRTVSGTAVLTLILPRFFGNRMTITLKTWRWTNSWKYGMTSV